MLDFVRNKQKSVIIKIAFAAIILSFIFGYAMLTSPGGDDPAAPTGAAAYVNGNAVAYEDFQIAYSNLYQLYQNIYQDQFNPALEKQLKLADKAFNSLVDQVLLLEEADALNFDVSEKELVQAIAEVEAFQENGRFNKARYLQVLNYQRLTTDQFEEMQRTELLIEKVRAHVQQNAFVAEADIEEEFRKINEKVNLEFVRLSPLSFEGKVKVTDEALQTYFDEDPEVFRIPEMVSLRYLQFVPDRYVDDVVIEQTDLERYYNRHLDQFDIPEQVKASHILIKVDPDADEKSRADKKAFAEKLLEDIKTGQDFAELARTYSDDTASSANGGDLDFFTRGTMVPPFEQAAFNLQPGTVSDIVETSFGYHIIKSEAYIEAGVKKLEDVRDQVELGVRVEKSAQVAFEKAMDAYNMNRKTGDLQAAADANELGLKETGLFTRDGYIDGIGRNEEIIDAAFVLEENGLARPVVTEEGVILFGLKERAASRIPEVEEVKDVVTAAFRRVKATELAKTAAEELLAALQVGGDIAKISKKNDYDLEETGDFTRTYSPFVPRIGTSEELAEAAFALPEGQNYVDQVFAIENRYVVAALKSFEAADFALLDAAKRDELQKSLLTRKQNEAIEQRLEELRAKATIEVLPNVQAILDQEK